MAAHIQRAIGYLTEQHALGYPNAVHKMGSYSTAKFVQLAADHLDLTADQVHRFSTFTCENKAFHVAMITDALQDALDAGHSECQAMVDENIDYLLGCRDEISWRYFPGFEPLPYDADSLGQMTQVLVRAGKATPETLADAFKLAALNAWEDGPISTFFATDPEDRIVINKIWGRGRDDTGRDAEVVANLLYGATLYQDQVGDSPLTPLLEIATKWLTVQQQPMGFWRAAWYVGTSYSTYVVVRQLVAAGGHQSSVDRAVRFLRQVPAPDPLNRALAMLAITAANCAPDRHDASLLHDTQFHDGSWEAIPLLDNHARIWGSRAVSTAICLKALLRQESQ
ncbi:hypothetical protein [Mycobacterium pseudoshottsii]|uniref:hypothetical protein n=1 Tax=Mycobacterium pseudoshottsii TaxID=265949 RepID=UPI000A324AD7|nr:MULTISPECIES: hypothetical protein [Mycobacterium ulcerans group]MBC9862528.1 hypothetical protein [Mycobacterium pseudoshottsii]RFZ64796.1 hypothetical protein DL240490_02396 [Mycobacterium marinum]BBA90568.1 hypothetical protein MPSD_53240 [Mycobacterium pseudoshottsii JCM 15466]